MQLLPQRINIELPCKPFKLKAQEVVKNDLHLFFSPTEVLICPECGQQANVHARATRKLQSEAVVPYHRTYWIVSIRRGRCSQCDVTFSEDIPFRFKKRGVTVDLAKRICEEMDDQGSTITAVAKRLHTSRDLVRRVHKDYLQDVANLETEPKGVKDIAIDEFSILKRHKYATLIISLEPRRVLYLTEGRGKKEVEPFFSIYSKEFYERLESCAMDQNHFYSKIVAQNLPHVTIVSDRFHMSLNYTRDVVDKVRLRVARAHLLSGDREGYELFKRSKYRLLTPKMEDPTLASSEDEFTAQMYLNKLLEMNSEIHTIVIMFEQMKALYDITDEPTMRKEWLKWLAMAEQSKIPELIGFAKRKRRYTDQIVAHAKNPVTSATIEGMMNKIKVIKRAAFGFRDFEYFFLRIRYAFMPEHIKDAVKRRLWKNCSGYLRKPLDHAKCS